MRKIKESVSEFANKNLFDATLALFSALNIPVNKISEKKLIIKDFFEIENKNLAVIKEIYAVGVVDDKIFKNKPTDLDVAALKKKDKYDALAIFAIELISEAPTRTLLAELTRLVNREMKAYPVIVVFKYGQNIALTNTERTNYKRTTKDGEKSGKVFILKDISVQFLHAGHERILVDLDLLNSKSEINNFESFYKYAQQVLSVNALNKNFFADLSNWYFWASENVKFPDDIKLDKDKKKDEEARNATNLIRLITRVIFVWFIKEKKLVPDNLFQEQFLKNALKEFNKNKKSSSYYSTILQNLFFGTLNQKMDIRSFVKDNDRIYYKEDYGIKNLYRFAENFAIAEKDAIKIFENIPFLNGGLFDCLDKPGDDKKIVYVDGFSRNKKKQAIVPDYLFFEKIPTEVDLTKYYNPDSKKPIIKNVKSLFEILNGYKFTVEENTPLEEEIALDPELLGKVFENLLAYYNPETQTTARKQTGSFYTPREIVSYMVDESLIAYLKTQMLNDNPAWLELGKNQTDMFGNSTRAGQLKMEQSLTKNKWKDREQELEEKLRDLVGYNNTHHTFTDDNDILHLIYAIDHAKILDPACGSGAFPMGVLHKLTYILSKLDEYNEKWKAVQKRNAQKEIDQALNDEDKVEREKKLIEINEAFTYNSTDYARKLYLIENCIYGVDIQPIAVQISKLRFFISLMVEQTERPKAENRGILPLPNLETKFVAANTLIGLDKPEGLDLRNEEIKTLEQKLAENRHKHFGTKSKKEKDALQADDKKIRVVIAEIIKGEYDELQKQISDSIKFDKEKLKQSKTGKHKPADATKQAKAIKALEKKIADLEALLIGNKGIDDLANKIASFDLYDQNKSADWFESEWMFGLTDGFDIVIGNPPYVQVAKGIFNPAVFIYSEGKDKGKQNLYKVFVEAAYNLGKPGAIGCMIVQSSLMCDLSSTHTRELLITKTRVEKLVEFPKNATNTEGQVFDSVIQGTCIYLFIKSLPDLKYDTNISINNDTLTISNLTFENINQLSLLQLYPETYYLPLIRKNDAKVLKKLNLNSIAFSEYINSINQGDLNLTANSSQFSATKTAVKLYRGRNVHRYHLLKEVEEFVKINFLKEKVSANQQQSYIVLQEITGTTDKYRLHACLTDKSEKFLFGHTANKILLNDDALNKFCMAILNSNLLDWFFRKTSTNNHVMGYEIKQFPFPKKEKRIQSTFSSTVDKIISLKENNPEANIGILEKQLDKMVYELYDLTEEEIKIIEGE